MKLATTKLCSTCIDMEKSSPVTISDRPAPIRGAPGSALEAAERAAVQNRDDRKVQLKNAWPWERLCL